MMPKFNIKIKCFKIITKCKKQYRENSHHNLKEIIGFPVSDSGKRLWLQYLKFQVFLLFWNQQPNNRDKFG